MAQGSIKFKFQGGKEIKRALRNLLPDRKARSVMRRVATKQGKALIKTMDPKVPEDGGDLRRSLAVSGTLTKHQKTRYAKRSPDDVVVFAGVSTRDTKAVLAYHHIQEYGSNNQNAQPYARPAWDQRQGVVVKEMGEDMWTEIDKAVKREARRTKRVPKS